MKTLEQLWNETYEYYDLTFDNKGNFKEGKGIVLNTICKESEELIKKTITKRRKNDLRVMVLWNKKLRCITQIERKN